MKLVCFGNPYVESDSLALELGKELGALFCSAPEDIMEFEDVVILDVVKDLKEPRIIRLDELKKPSSSSAHDFDLSFYLQLMREIKDINVKIIGIPMKGNKEEIVRKIKKLIRL